MAALAHNVLKMVRKLGQGLGPAAPADAIAAIGGHATDDAVADFPTASWCFARVSWLTLYLKPALR